MREEYKMFEKNTAAIKAAFENALTNCDNEIFKHEPQLANMMASVAAFVFDKNEIADFYSDGVDAAWHILTTDMQYAVYEWLTVLDMPRGELRNFKADIMRVYYHPSGYIDGVAEKYDAVDTLNENIYETGMHGRERVRTEYRSRNYFRRLVSIARMAGAAHAGEIATAATVAKPSRVRGAAGGSCAAAGHVGAADLLNDNAAQFVTDYKPAVSFHFRCADVEGVTVNMQSFSNGNIRPARLLLEKDCYKDGWCYVEKWTRPSASKCHTDEERIFFSHIESKTDSGVGAAGDKYYFRIAPKVVKRGHGGARAGSGRKRKTK